MRNDCEKMIFIYNLFFQFPFVLSSHHIQAPELGHKFT